MCLEFAFEFGMVMQFKRLILVVSVICAEAVFAGGLRCKSLWSDNPVLQSDLPKEALKNRGAHAGFIIPNEKEIGKHSAAFAALSAGLYLSVGTERGLMSAALSQGKIKALLQVDRDPQVVVYNRINRALLSLAKNREHYLQLRLRSSVEDWQKAMAQNSNLSPEDKMTFSDSNSWSWWQSYVVQNPQGWTLFHRDPKANNEAEYASANYLFDDVLFERVSVLAKKQKIFIVLDSLGSEAFLQRAEALSAALDMPIAGVDMSNAWQEGYMGHRNTLQFLRSLQSLMTPRSSLIFTYLAADPTRRDGSVFKYLFNSLSEKPDWVQLENTLAHMARLEPSQQQPAPRFRAQRFDDF